MRGTTASEGEVEVGVVEGGILGDEEVMTDEILIVFEMLEDHTNVQAAKHNLATTSRGEILDQGVAQSRLLYLVLEVSYS